MNISAAIAIALVGLTWPATGWASTAFGPPPPPPPVEPDVDPDDAEPYPPSDSFDEPADTQDTEDSPPLEPENDTLAPPGAEATAAAPAAGEEAAPDTTSTTEKPADPAEAEEAKPKFWNNKYLTISGYVQPQYTFRARTNARPRDQREFGADATRAGVIFEGEPLNRWSYNIHIVLGSSLINNITGVDLVDTEGDGNVDALAVTTEPTPGIFIERLVVNYRPVEYIRNERSMATVDLTLGQMRIPFTAQNRSPNTSLMFPRRSTPNNVFLLGTDLGGMAHVAAIDDRIEIAGGVYNGTGLAVGQSNERGALYAGRLDINPLGGFPFAEGDLERGPFRFGVGTGILYFPSRVFDDAGNDTRTRARDLRASASVRMQVRGFYLQGEFLRRQRTDSLSSLPLVATGAYGQTSFFFIVYKNIGMAPVGRFGWVTLDQSFDPRQAYFAEGGLAVYLANEQRPDAVRVLGQYLGEWRTTEQEQAHGAALQLQVRF